MNNVLDFIIECSRRSLHHEYSGNKIVLRFIAPGMLIRNRPRYVSTSYPPDIHVIGVPRLFPFFARGTRLYQTTLLSNSRLILKCQFDHEWYLTIVALVRDASHLSNKDILYFKFEFNARIQRMCVIFYV